MSAKVTILVGTMTGTAEMVAQEVETSLGNEGYSVAIEPMDNLAPDIFEREGAFLICTSTYGNGDVPDNARAFFEAIEAARPDLAAVAYGIIALGDRTYGATYCEGGKRFDALLSGLGARRLGEPMLHDAGSGTLPEEVAADWALAWAGEHLAERRAAA
ncbi:MAG: flavodoxin domain-containing protein [Ferrovibrionaceae bacterium]